MSVKESEMQPMRSSSNLEVKIENLIDFLFEQISLARDGFTIFHKILSTDTEYRNALNHTLLVYLLLINFIFCLGYFVALYLGPNLSLAILA